MGVTQPPVLHLRYRHVRYSSLIHPCVFFRTKFNTSVLWHNITLCSLHLTKRGCVPSESQYFLCVFYFTSDPALAVNQRWCRLVLQLGETINGKSLLTLLRPYLSSLSIFTDLVGRRLLRQLLQLKLRLLNPVGYTRIEWLVWILVYYNKVASVLSPILRPDKFGKTSLILITVAYNTLTSAIYGDFVSRVITISRPIVVSRLWNAIQNRRHCVVNLSQVPVSQVWQSQDHKIRTCETMMTS